MKYLKIFIIITFLMFSVSASAEFYKYVDDEGNVRFTDDINQVPEAQRAKIRSYIESENQESDEQEAARWLAIACRKLPGGSWREYLKSRN